MIVIGRSDLIHSEDTLYFPSDDSLIYQSVDNSIPDHLWNILVKWLEAVSDSCLNHVSWKILKEELEDTVRYILSTMNGFFSGKRLPLLMTASVCLSSLYLSEEKLDMKRIVRCSSGLFDEIMLYQHMIELVRRIDLDAKRPRKMIPTQNPRKILSMLHRDCMKREWEIEWETDLKWNREMI